MCWLATMAPVWLPRPGPSLQANIGPVPASAWRASFWLPGLSHIWSVSGWELPCQDLFATTQPDQDQYFILSNGPIQKSQHWSSTGISLACQFLAVRVEPTLVRFWQGTGTPRFINHETTTWQDLFFAGYLISVGQ